MVTKAALEAENARLRARMEELGIDSESEPPANLPSKEGKISDPPEFDGKPSEFSTFITLCDLVFRVKFLTYTTDYTKVAYVISRCRKGPALWGQSLIEADSELLHNYDDFRAQMVAIYGDKQRTANLRQRLTSLEQTGSVSTYASEFLSLANILGTDENSRIAIFTSNLKPEIQRQLSYVRGLDTFEKLVDAAIEIDTVAFRLSKTESRKSTAGKSSTSKPASPSTSVSNSSFSTSRSSQSSTSSSSSPKSPRRSAPRPPITQEERDRRDREGLCRYCGGKGHLRNECPELRNKLDRERNRDGTRPQATTSSVIPTQIILPGTPPAYPVLSGKPESQNP